MAKNKEKNIESEVETIQINETEVENVQISESGEAAIVQSKPRKKKMRLKYQDRYAIAGVIFALPFIVGFAVFKLAPLIVSLQLSFSQVTSMDPYTMQWNKDLLFNYHDMFFNTTYDGRLLTACITYVKDTIIELPVVNILAFFFAILLNKKMPGQSTYRAIFFLPVLIGSGYAYNIMSQYMSDGLRISVPGGFLYYLGGSEVVGYVWEFFDVFVSALWKTGVQVLLYLTGLQGISKTLYESAYCDGATEWEQFWKITLPMMTPTILLCLVYTLIIKHSDASNPFASYYMNVPGSDEIIVSNQKLAVVSWVYTLLSIVFIGVVFLIMNPIIKKNGGRD